MPSVALRVVDFTLSGGFESLTLRHAVWTAEKNHAFCCEMRKVPVFRDDSFGNRTGENGLLAILDRSDGLSPGPQAAVRLLKFSGANAWRREARNPDLTFA
jgi:hypothetical protein